MEFKIACQTKEYFCRGPVIFQVYFLLLHLPPWPMPRERPEPFRKAAVKDPPPLSSMQPPFILYSILLFIILTLLNTRSHPGAVPTAEFPQPLEQGLIQKELLPHYGSAGERELAGRLQPFLERAPLLL